MTRYLCLVIGKDPSPARDNYLPLTKGYGEPKRLDAFIMNHFANSEEVRQHYKDKIDAYLSQNNFNLSNLGKNYRGSIVIVEESPGSPPRKVRVLYSDTREKLEKMLNDNTFMRRLAEDDEFSTSSKLKLFSPYLIDSILMRNGQDYPRSELKVMLFRWKDGLKEQYYGTDKLRFAFKKYEEFQKEVRAELKRRKIEYSGGKSPKTKQRSS